MHYIQRFLVEKDHVAHRQMVWLSCMLIPAWFQMQTLLFLTQIHSVDNCSNTYRIGLMKILWCCCGTIPSTSSAAKPLYDWLSLSQGSRFPTWLLLYLSGWIVALWPRLRCLVDVTDGIHDDIQDISGLIYVSTKMNAQFPWILAPFCVASGVLFWLYHCDSSVAEQPLTEPQDTRPILQQVLQSCMQRAMYDVRVHVSRTIREDDQLQAALMKWVFVDSWLPAASRPETSTSTSPGSMNSKDMAGTPLSAAGSTTPQSSRASEKGDPNDFWRSLCDTDLDKHAQPAVLAYKQSVDGFPPNRNIALIVAVLAQCPAFLACMQMMSLAHTCAISPGHFESSFLLLLPLVVLDILMVQKWTSSCHVMMDYRRSGSNADVTTSGNSNSENALLFWQDRVDQMTLLLTPACGALQSSPPTLLRLWWNVVDSVKALEAAMTTARCVQTTAVVVDLGHNIQSLAEFSLEVYDEGWIHGLGLLFQELVASIDDTHGRGSPSRYINAATGAVRNSQRLYNNTQVLSNDNNVLFAITRGVVSGREWSGGEEEAQNRHEDFSNAETNTELSSRLGFSRPTTTRGSFSSENIHREELCRKNRNDSETSSTSGAPSIQNAEQATSTLAQETDHAENEYEKVLWSMATVGLAAAGAVAASAVSSSRSSGSLRQRGTTPST